MGNPRQVLLASSSPRRRALLEAAGFEIDVHRPVVDETWPGGPFESGTVTLARRKLETVPPSPTTVIAADTVVVLADEALGKPRDADDAARLLSRLAGCLHRVVTGFCVRRGGLWRQGAVSTEVRFRRVGRGEIERYVATGEPLDKAGAYGIQGRGGALVDTVRGSYTNVVGLPLAEVIACVRELAEQSHESG